jgi:hypothetical protein
MAALYTAQWNGCGLKMRGLTGNRPRWQALLRPRHGTYQPGPSAGAPTAQATTEVTIAYMAAAAGVRLDDEGKKTPGTP